MFSKKCVYSVAALSACGLLAAGNAFAAHVIESATDEVKIQIYGQVNRAILFADDGAETHTFHVDNDHSSTRLGFKGKVSPTDDLTAGMKIEVEIRSNPSNAVDQVDDGTTISDDGFKERKMEAFLQSKRLGTVTIGHGSEATDGIAEIDLSYTKVAGYSDVRKLGGDILFTDEAADTLTGLHVDTFAFTVDGGRLDRIRYDSPKFAGFGLSASSGEDGQEALALRYSRDFSVFKLAAGIGYETTGTIDQDLLGGSASILFKNGLNFTVAAGEKNLDMAGRNDPGMVYGKIGYKTSIFAAGPTAVSFDYGNYEDNSANEDEIDVFGIQLVQDLTDWGTQLYMGYRNFDAERPGENLNDINVLMTGVRVKF